MRLLNTETGRFVERVDPESKFKGPHWVYAILSHTWDEDGEQTYEQLKKIQQRHPKPQAPQSRPGPDGGTSSPLQQDLNDPPATPPTPVSQSLHDSSSATPLIASTPPKSWFARKTARLRRWCQRHCARNAPKPSSTNHSTPPTSPPTAFGRLTQSEVDALFRSFGEVYGLTSPTPPPAMSSDHPAPATRPPQSIWNDPDLSPKIRDACAVARKNGYRYIWIDSCCIDKSSSSELSEAINSMYKWYALADVCYAYLADVPPGDDHHAGCSLFRRSRWFERGWTLQELIAPVNVVFLSEDWAPIGSKHALDGLVESVTGINRRALLHLDPLDKFSVAQRLSWAAKRWTTRKEDGAYSLLGIFNIHMPTLYGEGDHAFHRLQEQIMQHIPDQSLFAWQTAYMPDSQPIPKNPSPKKDPITLEAYRSSPPASLFCRSFYWFGDNRRHIRHVQFPTFLHYEIEYTPTPYGVRTQFQMIPLTLDLLSAVLPHHEVEFESPVDDPSHGPSKWYLSILGCELTEYPWHLLGRVCYIPPSDSGVELVYIGLIESAESSKDSRHGHRNPPDLIPLSPDTIQHFRPHIELKTVYIHHPSPADPLQSLRLNPYIEIKLVLLAETHDALHSRGYKADFRDPDLHHPITHRLTLSKSEEHTITVEFHHIVFNCGYGFSMNADVRMSGSGVHLASASASVSDSSPDRRIRVVWSDCCSWSTKLDDQKIIIILPSAAGGGTLIVHLGLDFAGTGVYFVRVDVESYTPPAPAEVESAPPVASVVESVGEEGREDALSRDDSPSCAIDTEGSGSGREADIDGREMASGEVREARDLEAAIDEAGDDDEDDPGELT